MPTDDTPATGGLAYEYNTEITDANDADSAPDDDWTEPLPSDKLWVHPDVPYDATAFCDDDTFSRHADDGPLVVACPMPGCPHEFDLHATLTYEALLTADGCVSCGDCDEPVLAHQNPPRGWTPPSNRSKPGQRGRGRSRP